MLILGLFHSYLTSVVDVGPASDDLALFFSLAGENSAVALRHKHHLVPLVASHGPHQFVLEFVLVDSAGEPQKASKVEESRRVLIMSN